MSPETTNGITVAVFFLPWAAWLGWEIYLLIRRGSNVRVKTLSMVALERGRHLSSVVYLWGGMASHWWWPSAHFAPVWAGVVFWALILPLLAHDVGRWNISPTWWVKWERVAFNPLVVLALGFVAGKVLFPQVG